MDYFLKVVVPRALQDALTAFAAYLASVGNLTQSQEVSFIGAAFFLIMLVINAVVARCRRRKVALEAGMAVAEQTNDVATDKDAVRAILKDASVK